MTPLCLALMAALAAPVRADDSYKTYSETEFLGYVNMYAKFLMNDHALDFAGEKGRYEKLLAPLELVDAAGGSGGNAEYDQMDYKVYGSRAAIKAAQTEVLATCKDLAPDLTLNYVLAVHFLPTYLHELRHSYSHGTLGESGNNLEEETAGFINTMMAYRRVRKEHEDAYKCGTPFSAKDYQISERFWKPDGVDGIKKFLKSSKFYGKACSVLGGDAAGCCASARKHYDALKAYVDGARAAGTSDSQICEDMPSKVDGASCKSYRSDKTQGVNKELLGTLYIRSFWCSDKMQEKARDYYNKEFERGNAEYRKL